MDLTHSFTVPASKAETWSTFEDIESVAGCFPGATVTSVDGDDFKGSCKVKLGPIALTYSGSGTFVEKDESAGRFVVQAKGKDRRGNGTAGATVTATFTEEGSSTRVDVATDLAITGKPAQFGRGVIQDVSDKLLQQFVTCLESKVGSSGAEDGAASVGSSSDSDAGSADSAAAGSEASASASDSAVDAPTAVPAAGSPAEGAPSTATVGVTAEAAARPTAEATSPVETPPAPPTRPTPTTPVATPVPSTPGAASPATTAASRTADGGSSLGSSGTQSTPGESAAGGGQDDALDLGATVLPVLLKAYGRQIAAGVGLLLVGYLLGRRRRG